MNIKFKTLVAFVGSAKRHRSSSCPSYFQGASYQLGAVIDGKIHEQVLPFPFPLPISDNGSRHFNVLDMPERDIRMLKFGRCSLNLC